MTLKSVEELFRKRHAELKDQPDRGGGGGVMPYMCHTETCRQSKYTFWPSNPRQVSFFEPDSKTGCQICTITPSQGAYSQYCLAPSH